MVTLQPFNTIALAAATPTQLVASTMGNYTVQLLNLGPGDLQISSDPAMASFFTLPASMGFPVSIWGPTGIWVSAAEAAEVSAALVPR